MAGGDDLILKRIRDAQSILEALEHAIGESKTPKDRFSTQEEIRRQKQTIQNLKHEWMSRNPGKAFPFHA